MGKSLQDGNLFSNFASDFVTKGRSPVGLERFSHIEEVAGSSPAVPTNQKEETRAGLFFRM